MSNKTYLRDVFSNVTSLKFRLYKSDRTKAQREADSPRRSGLRPESRRHNAKETLLRVFMHCAFFFAGDREMAQDNRSIKNVSFTEKPQIWNSYEDKVLRGYL